jgi:hypothetical protein
VSVVLRLAVDLAEEERGGRRRPLRDGFRASLSFGRRRRDVEPIVHDAVLVFEDVSELEPGASAMARAWMFDELPRRGVDEGDVVALLERDRIVGRAEILAFADDPTPSPLADLTAAKTRALVLREDA